jgi:hypothetical protein
MYFKKNRPNLIEDVWQVPVSVSSLAASLVSSLQQPVSLSQLPQQAVSLSQLPQQPVSLSQLPQQQLPSLPALPTRPLELPHIGQSLLHGLSNNYFVTCAKNICW